MNEEKLDLYFGKLTLEQIVAGMSAASSNAARLYKDAQILFKKGSYPSSVALSILSIEEIGKMSILRALSLAKNENEAVKIWKQYRSHRSKNAHWIFPDLVAKGARKLDDFLPMFDARSNHSIILDKLKQVSLYTDCLGKAHWSEPTNVIDKKLAESLLKNASIRFHHSKISVRELELFVKHVGPVRAMGGDVIKRALIDWYADMQKCGLKPKGKKNMEWFIRFVG